MKSKLTKNMIIPQITSNNVFWKFVVLYVYRIIGLLCAAIALVAFYVSLSVPLEKWLAIVLYISYIVLYVILAYGFWKMRKWVTILMSCTLVFLIINNAISFFQDTQKISSALWTVFFAGVILLFSYVSRSRLGGEYKNVRVIRVFAVFLILSQILAYFLSR